MKQLTTLNPFAEAFITGTFIMMIVLGIGVNNSFEMNVLEMLAVYTSFICTYLCVIQSRLNYVMGVITTAIYSVVFWQANLLGSMVLNIYLIPTLIYGWFIWGPDSNTKKVQWVEFKVIPIYILVTILTYLGALGIITLFGGEMAPLDSLILIGTILAQFLLDRKKIETWAIWVFVNIVSIYVYWNAGLSFVAIQYMFFLANTFFGSYMWYKSMIGSYMWYKSMNNEGRNNE